MILLVNRKIVMKWVYKIYSPILFSGNVKKQNIETKIKLPSSTGLNDVIPWKQLYIV